LRRLCAVQQFCIFFIIFTLSRIIALLFNHSEFILITIFLILLSRCSSSHSPFLFKERLIFIINLRVILALPSTHILPPLVPSDLAFIFVLIIKLSVHPLIPTHIRSAHHSNSFVKITLVLFCAHYTLTSLLKFTNTGTVVALKVTTDFCIDIVRVVMV